MQSRDPVRPRPFGRGPCPKFSLRISVGIAGLAALSACSSGGSQVATGASSDYFVSHAAGDYRPPGPASDPWGPYIRAASHRFDVPSQWVRHVMQAESGGHEYMDGQLTVSPAGAMGLMQLEPETYQEMANRYGLGDDPFNPYDNIMAGTAYIHEMYEVYGSPGFLAAYDAGPGRLDNFMDAGRPLPHETTNYIAMIAPEIQGYYPEHRSEADQLALNTMPQGENGLLPLGEAPGPLPSPDQPAVPVEVADALPTPDPESAVYTPEPARSAPAPTPHFALISSAMADTPAPHSAAYESSGNGWAIQVGAFSSRESAKAALGIAELSAVQVLMHGTPVVVSIHGEYGAKYRARFVDLGHEQALDACERLRGGPTSCVILSPDSQG